jgi:hypothetical protein
MKEKTAFALEGFKNQATDRIEYSRPGKRPAPMQVFTVEPGAEPPEYLYRESDDWAAKYAQAYDRDNGEIVYVLIVVEIKP